MNHVLQLCQEIQNFLCDNDLAAYFDNPVFVARLAYTLYLRHFRLSQLSQRLASTKQFHHHRSGGKDKLASRKAAALEQPRGEAVIC